MPRVDHSPTEIDWNGAPWVCPADAAETLRLFNAAIDKLHGFHAADPQRTSVTHAPRAVMAALLAEDDDALAERLALVATQAIESATVYRDVALTTLHHAQTRRGEIERQRLRIADLLGQLRAVRGRPCAV